MELKELMEFANNGMFPMLIAGYLIIRIEKKLDDLTHAIIELKAQRGAE